MTESVRALVIGSNETSAVLVTELEKAGLPVRSKAIDSEVERAWRSVTARRHWDVILAGLLGFGISALKALEILREAANLTPLIVVSGAVWQRKRPRSALSAEQRTLCSRRTSPG